MSHVPESLVAPPPKAVSADDTQHPVMEAAERTASALREMAGNLVSKRSAKALLKERNNLRDELRQLQEKTNAVWLVQRNKLLQQELAEADKGKGRFCEKRCSTRTVSHHVCATLDQILALLA